tara:strand:- start:202 stop:441 length:240 start_codon:yes stop_codon:yes gene_type:complete
VVKLERLVVDQVVVVHMMQVRTNQVVLLDLLIQIILNLLEIRVELLQYPHQNILLEVVVLVVLVVLEVVLYKVVLVDKF